MQILTLCAKSSKNIFGMIIVKSLSQHRRGDPCGRPNNQVSNNTYIEEEKL